MYQDRIYLTSKDIYEKVFKVDTKGYRPQEVDKYLDAIIRDYDEYDKIIRELEAEKKEIIEDNIKLKQEIRRLRMQIEAIKEGSGTGSEVNNSDLLRRISNLEKIIYGK